MTEYNFAYLDEQTKRMIRRAILKACHSRLSGPFRLPRDANALWLGNRRRAGVGCGADAQGHVQGDRPRGR